MSVPISIRVIVSAAPMLIGVVVAEFGFVDYTLVGELLTAALSVSVVTFVTLGASTAKQRQLAAGLWLIVGGLNLYLLEAWDAFVFAGAVIFGVPMLLMGGGVIMILTASFKR